MGIRTCAASLVIIFAIPPIHAETSYFILSKFTLWETSEATPFDQIVASRRAAAMPARQDPWAYHQAWTKKITADFSDCRIEAAAIQSKLFTPTNL